MTLDGLLAGLTDENRQEKVAFDLPVGKEGS